jgi:hypothetical protein
MRNIINKISRAVQVVLLAPIKLPGKALNILKYVAVGLGIIESVLDNGKQESETGEQGSSIGDNAILDAVDVDANQGSELSIQGTGEDDETPE